MDKTLVFNLTKYNIRLVRNINKLLPTFDIKNNKILECSHNFQIEFQIRTANNLVSIGYGPRLNFN